MRAARLHDTRDLRVDDVDDPSPGPWEVRVDVAACGICGSDLHEYVGPAFAPAGRAHPLTGEQLPLTMGHELAGTVGAVGDEVASLAVGDEVTVNPVLWCGDCRYCEAGDYHLCRIGGFLGLHADGGFADSVVVDAEQVVPLEGISLREGALVEPLTVGLHAVRRSALRAGDTAAVFGAGPIGLAVVQAAVAAGAREVVVSEPREVRRERALASGASDVVDPRADDQVERVREAIDGGADVAFEVAGVEATVEGAIRATKHGGDVTVVSLFEEAVAVQVNPLVFNERTLTGSAAYRGGPQSGREFGATIEMLADGRFDPDPLVTSRLPLEAVADGFEALLDENSDEVKVLVES